MKNFCQQLVVIILVLFLNACGDSGSSKTLSENVDATALEPEPSPTPSIEPDPSPTPRLEPDSSQGNTNTSNKTLSSSPHDFYTVNNKLIFTAWTQATGRTLWVVDNEGAEPRLLNDTVTAGGNITASYREISTYPVGFKHFQPQIVQGQVFLRFTALGDVGVFEAGRAIWITDASSEGTSVLIELAASESFAQAYSHGQHIYILSSDRAWRYDVASAELTPIDLQFLPLARLEDNDKKLIWIEFDSQTGRFLYLLRAGDEVQLWDYLAGSKRQLRSYNVDIIDYSSQYPLGLLRPIEVVDGQAFVIVDGAKFGDSVLEKIDLDSLQVETVFSDWRIYFASDASSGSLYIGTQAAPVAQNRLYAYDIESGVQTLLMSSDLDLDGTMLDEIALLSEDLQSEALLLLEYSLDSFQVFSSGETIHILLNIYSSFMENLFGPCGAEPEHTITWYQLSPVLETAEMRSHFDVGCTGWQGLGLASGIEPFVSAEGNVAFLINAYGGAEGADYSQKVSAFDSAGDQFIADDDLLTSAPPSLAPAISWLGNTVFYGRSKQGVEDTEDIGNELYRISAATGDERFSNFALDN